MSPIASLRRRRSPIIDVTTLPTKIGEVTLTNDFFIRRAPQEPVLGLSKDRPSQRKAMIDRDRNLSIVNWAKASGSALAGSATCRVLRAGGLAVIQRMDELHLESPSRSAGCCAIYDTVSEARAAIGRYRSIDNGR